MRLSFSTFLGLSPGPALLLAAALLGGCQQSISTRADGLGDGNPQIAAASIPNPVLPGDYPDPSVTKVGDTYWATATTSNWGPVFPLLSSKNLTEWKLVGHVFPQGRPAWADYYFWAPEISEEGGKTYVYYTAHKRGGNLAVGVASAARPEGPYTDHGPLVGQPHGSIDGFPMRDENGKLFLIWKEDGNSVQQPTPIWAQAMNEERTALTGEKKELFRNNPATWEGNLVEGVSIIRHQEYFYAFYAGNGCCGRGCTYATGVARAKSLLGPWEKYEKNPVLVNNDTWKCPGHGTAVEQGGRWYMLHHAYAAGSHEFAGRQGVLSEFEWTPGGWPEFKSKSTPIAPARPARTQAFTDEFSSKALQAAWQWPVELQPSFALSGGQLRLSARPDHSGAALGLATTAAQYTASTTLLNPGGLAEGLRAGLAAHGDPDNTLMLVAGAGKVELVQLEKGKATSLGSAALPAAKALQLRVQAREGSQFSFAWSTDGRSWQSLPASGAAVSGSFLPPWDRGVRVGVIAQGPAAAAASFESFSLSSQP